MYSNAFFAFSFIFLNKMLFIESQEGYCENNNFCKEDSSRFLLYDVNPPEGFNLRRDVYMRFAVFVHKMKNSKDEDLNKIKLVLPPWSNLFHWRTNTADEQYPWSYFFDLNSLKKFAPVIEMYEFFKELGPKYSKITLDAVYVLQHFKDMFETNNFEDRMLLTECNELPKISYFYYKNITSKNVKCLSFHGKASDLSRVLKNSSYRTILFDHAEVALHDWFGDKLYWQARRSMRFNKDLVEIANAFRTKFLNSTDELDNTTRPIDWMNEKPKRNALGGPYLSLHMRRRDFVRGRPTQVPSLKSAAQQIVNLLTELKLNNVFIASDAPYKEFENLKELIGKKYNVLTYIPMLEVEKKYGPGGVAIIDQIICSHARHFVGTHESTFSFRIQEEREIMGFPEKSTFNRLCGDNEKSKCEEPSVWKIVF